MDTEDVIGSGMSRTLVDKDGICFTIRQDPLQISIRIAPESARKLGEYIHQHLSESSE